MEDLEEVADEYRVDTNVRAFDAAFASTADSGRSTKSRLMRAIWSVTKWEFLAGSAWKEVGDALNFVLPVLLAKFVEWVGDESTAPFYDEYYGYILAVVMFSVIVLRGIALQYSYALVMAEGMKARTILTACIYRKALQVTSKELEDASAGKIINMMSTDTKVIEYLFYFGFYIWAAPIQLIVVCSLLVYYLGWSSLVAAGLMVRT